MKRRYCVLRTIFAGVMVAALFSGVRVWGQEAAVGAGAAEFDEADAGGREVAESGRAEPDVLVDSDDKRFGRIVRILSLNCSAKMKQWR